MTRAPPRGHLLLETLAAGALIILVISATSSALVQSSRDAAIAREDQQAFALAEAELETLRALPLSHARWTAAVTGPTALATPGWTQTVTVADLADPALAGVSLKHAVVVIAYRGRSARVETYRWNAPPP